MADLSRTVEVIFGAVDKNTKATIDSIGGSLATFDAGIQKVADPVANLTEGLLKAEAGVAALAAAFLTASANESSRFSEKMKEIGSLINATPEKVAALGTSIQQFALHSTSDFDKINQAVYIATSNLGDTGKAMDILGIAEKGAVVGATDLEASTALLTRTMNAYGLVTSDSATNTANAERVMAAMFTTVQNGDINMTALADNLGKVASSAAAAGIPIEAALWQQVKNGANVYITTEDGLWKIKNATEGYISAADKAGDASKNAANKAAEGSKEWKTVQEIMLATSKQTNDFTIQLGELANNRYEIDVRAAVDLRTAEIEAETSRINQALQSTVDAADSLRQGTTDLWDIFGKKAGFVGGEEIKSAALNMERRLDEELAVKKQLTDALVEQFKAQTVRLTSGEPLISIDARELAPELELVFDKILKYTQVKATQQGLAMLVGL